MFFWGFRFLWSQWTCLTAAGKSSSWRSRHSGSDVDPVLWLQEKRTCWGWLGSTGACHWLLTLKSRGEELRTSEGQEMVSVGYWVGHPYKILKSCMNHSGWDRKQGGGKASGPNGLLCEALRNERRKSQDRVSSEESPVQLFLWRPASGVWSESWRIYVRKVPTLAAFLKSFWEAEHLKWLKHWITSEVQHISKVNINTD